MTCPKLGAAGTGWQWFLTLPRRAARRSCATPNAASALDLVTRPGDNSRSTPVFSASGTFMNSAAPLPLFPNSVVSNDIDFITDDDPSAFVSVTFTGRARKEMPGDGLPGLHQDQVYLFDMRFSDGATIEIRADQRFASVADALAEVEHFAGPLGKLPGFMRQDLSHVVFNIGDRGAFAEASGRFFVVSSENMAARRSTHDMEETIFHETIHATLDARHLNTAAWQDAQVADGVFITDYAARRPDKEDLAETALFYYTYRYHPDRLSDEIIDAMRDGLPARIAVLDDIFGFDASQLVPGLRVTGTVNDDSLAGDDGADTILGLGGNDTVLARGGNDRVETQGGNDKVWGAAGDDSLFTQSGADTVGGGDGNDLINAGAGNDRAWGGRGDDTVFGADGNDSMAGAAGNDALWAGAGDDVVFGADGDDRIAGGSGSDVLWGGTGSDLIFGASGDDTIHGLDGDDTIWGGTGADDLTAGAGNDIVHGIDGADRIDGGTGNDTLAGGAGSDLFVFSPGIDLITDFDAADRSEKIDLRATSITGFSDLTAGHLTQVGTDLVIDDLAGNTTTISNLQLSDLSAENFLF
jgi:hemolysin type calcium-binding protein